METVDAHASIALASRILARQGVVDGFGHVSRRCEANPDRFLMSRSLAPALVRAGDIVELDLAGNCEAPSAPPLFLERFIHAAIYRARPDVMAVVHSHAAAVLPFTVVHDVSVRPICHICGFLEGVSQPFDVADHAGDASDLLIRNEGLGAEFARHLDGAAVGLMRGHGFTTVGASVAQAVFRAIYTVRNCEVQAAALQLGSPKYLSSGEARSCEETTIGQADRAWNLWVHDLGQEQEDIFHDR
ncbi:class II aldolase/adducin family protein [Novosphingobium sp. RL4]|uniref:class II aldolase/adducin family protein n=1 Tax=Novosphingobium sp. RL4 TaxID=3109595 RepID=UPI002D7A214C|nr:class II aldolase/adducin family protein [Novosphingobium sp. RL4]WRT94426.1 class II aldolase/adducin family protein [Novosphingobium sp. RL4]